MRQHTSPIFIDGDRSWTPKRIQFGERNYNEQWLQDLIHLHCETLPILEIEPAFSNPIPLCKELETKSGYCDNIFVNARGYLTVVECKLWRNPEARRSVLAQVLDYAKDIAKWNYQEFEKAVLKARKGSESSLFEIVQQREPDTEESDFIDTLSANIKSARMLLLIIGDGIRENAEELLGFLNTYTRMQFVLSFVEMPVFQVQGENDKDNKYIITPRIIATTRELHRYVDTGNYSISISSSAEKSQSGSEPSKSLSEEIFYERLGLNLTPEVSDRLRVFVSMLQGKYLICPKLGRGKKLSLNLKSNDDRFNFASIQETGEVYYYGIVDSTNAVGDKNIGIDYLKKLASMLDGQFFDGYSRSLWCIKKNGTFPLVSDYLANQQVWEDAIHQVIEQIKRMEDI